MPSDVVSRAWDLLEELEGEAQVSGSNTGYQLHMLPGDHEEHKLDNVALQELRDLDLQNMTPLDAINALARLQEQLTVPKD
jgi:DNA mismatch repair ATPase MutS